MMSLLNFAKTPVSLTDELLLSGFFCGVHSFLFQNSFLMQTIGFFLTFASHAASTVLVF